MHTLTSPLGSWLAIVGHHPHDHQRGPGSPYGHGSDGSFNMLAIVAIVAGIFGLTGFGSLIAVVCGIVALRQIKKTGQRGRALAIIGLVLGLVQALLLFVIVVVAGGSLLFLG